jgi:hypothetical protein
MDTIRKKLEALAFRPVEIDQIMGIVSDHIVEKHEKVESDWIDYLWERHFKDDARRERQKIHNTMIHLMKNMCRLMLTFWMG